MLTNIVILLILILCLFHQSFCRTYYNNYTLYRGIPVNQEHLDFYKNLSFLYKADFWRTPGLLNRPVDFIIGPKEKPAFFREVSRRGLYLTTVIDDVQDVLNMQTVKTYLRRRTETFDWLHFFRLADIYTWMKDITALYPKKLKIRLIGKTHENREILAAVLNHRERSKRDHRSLPLKRVVIEGGIHAREWVSPAVVTYIMNEVLHAEFSDDDELKKIAYLYEWFFVPVLNPDGYEYTHTNDRLWRKNRNGYGVDLNRNFGHHFGVQGVSFREDSETFCGPNQFSESESQAMATFVKSASKDLEFYFAFHSYGQFIIIPYADTKEHLDNFEDVQLLARYGAKQLQKVYGTKYTVGTAYDTVGYLVSGISADWVKKTFDVPIVSTFELRDSGRYGFALPPNLIIPTSKETLEALKAMMRPRGENWRQNYKPESLSGSRSNTQNDFIMPVLLVVCIVFLFIERFKYFWSFIFRLFSYLLSQIATST